jgi:predicted amidophosphoribosyltransferase
MTFEIICAWCGRLLGTKECNCPGSTENRTTHGICDGCKEKVLAELQSTSTNTPNNPKDE